MCTGIRNFYNSNKCAILWTVGYVIVSWAIMRYMFNFNIFSAMRWHQLMHAHLHGFAGFVFGILILAMIPLYVATTIVIARTNAPLFNFKIKIPEFIKTFFQKAFTQTPMDDEPESTPATNSKNESELKSALETETKSEIDSTTTESKPDPVPSTVPAEMRIAYERARSHATSMQSSVFDLGNVTKKPSQIVESAATAPESEIPIPTDFDIDDTENIINEVPVFTDLDFDDDNDDDETESESQTINVQTMTGDNDVVTKYLTEHSIPYTLENDIVITNKFAIASHTDSDFWVADNESWFAAGKIRKSPIASVMEIAATNKLQPVLYLGTDNIMDIDELRQKWTDAGIRVITDLDELK